MITVFKFALPLEELFTLHLPEGAEFLSVQVQAGSPQMWFRVDTGRRPRAQIFGICGTGCEIDNRLAAAPFKGTFQLNGGAFVFHLFGGLYE